MKPRMTLGDSAYSKLVERKQMEIRGNVTSVKLTEAECAQEVASIVPPVFHPELNIEQYEVSPIQQAAENAGIIKRKRGRPPGSKNRPKSGEK